MTSRILVVAHNKNDEIDELNEFMNPRVSHC